MWALTAAAAILGRIHAAAYISGLVGEPVVAWADGQVTQRRLANACCADGALVAVHACCIGIVKAGLTKALVE